MTSFDTHSEQGQRRRMVATRHGVGDSRRRVGGSIPDSGNRPAYSFAMPDPSPIPILIAVPHAGRSYPGKLLNKMRNPGFACLRLEDRYADRIAEIVASSTGAALLVAHAPRAVIDLNRAVDEMDWSMVQKGTQVIGSNRPAGRRARRGLGLVPSRLPGFGEIWKEKFDVNEIRDRIESIHEPYHLALSDFLVRLRERWGAALLVDIHSMPPLSRATAREPAPKIVLGDRFGTSCDGSLVARAFDHLAGLGLVASHNRPYAGGYVLDRHGAPQRGIHALQLEICRSTYLDYQLAEPSDKLEAMAATISGLIRSLALEVAGLGRAGHCSQAAE